MEKAAVHRPYDAHGVIMPALIGGKKCGGFLATLVSVLPNDIWNSVIIKAPFYPL